MIYIVGTLVLVGLLLAAHGVHVPWYVFVFVFPAVAFVVVLVGGNVALALERRRNK